MRIILIEEDGAISTSTSSSSHIATPFPMPCYYCHYCDPNGYEQSSSYYRSRHAQALMLHPTWFEVRWLRGNAAPFIIAHGPLMELGAASMRMCWWSKCLLAGHRLITAYGQDRSVMYGQHDKDLFWRRTKLRLRSEMARHWTPRHASKGKDLVLGTGVVMFCPKGASVVYFTLFYSCK